MCQTLCDPKDWSKPGFPVLHHLSELAQNHAHWVGDAINHLFLCHPLLLLLSIFPSNRSFLMSWLFISGVWSIGASASASVLPMNIQDWFPLGLTGLISLWSKGLSRVFSSSTVQRHQFFHSWNSVLLCLKVNVLIFFQISRIIILIKVCCSYHFLVNPFCHTKQKRQCVLSFTQLSSWAILCVLAHVCHLRTQLGASFLFHCFSIWRKHYDSWQGIWLMFSTLLK